MSKEIIKGVDRLFRHQQIGKKDMFGKNICEGHICAVRYAWSSYAAPVGYYKSGFKLLVKTSLNGHQIDDKGTYQIIGHWDKDHIDYNKEVKDWLKDTTKKCPVKICVYDNIKQAIP